MLIVYENKITNFIASQNSWWVFRLIALLKWNIYIPHTFFNQDRYYSYTLVRTINSSDSFYNVSFI